jgi:trimeric autotransporter adhesin
MKNYTRNFRALVMSILSAILCFSQVSMVYAQDTTFANTDTPLVCGATSDFFQTTAIDTSTRSRYAALLPVGYHDALHIAPTAIFNCSHGLIDLYIEDVNSHTGRGFDDPTPVGSSTLGAVRIQTFCAVLQYVQSTFTFSVLPTSHIRVYVAQSYAPGTSLSAPTAGPLSFSLYAAAAFHNDPTVVTGITGGLLNLYATTGVDHAVPTDYHAEVVVNFDHTYDAGTGVSTPVLWQSDYLAPYVNCNVDLYSALLHEMTHAMGWESFISFPAGLTSGATCSCPPWGVLPVAGATPLPGALTGPHLFTKLDWAMYGGGSVFPVATGMQKLIVGSIGTPSVNALAPAAANNYWITNNSAPDNYPVYSGTYDPSVVPQYFSHLDDQPLSYTLRERISPGDRLHYVMGPYGVPGLLKRTYTKAEIQTLNNVLGYAYIGGGPTLSNHLPFSKKMAALGITALNYANFTENAAVLTDYTLINTGAFIDIYLTDPAFTTADLVDADGDPLTIDLTTLVNIRGCGLGGNNHNELAVLSPTHLRYTPRQNFYGLAQFGFNVNDGHENGSFRVVTIDVQRGSNVSAAFSGGNYVCNGDFEEGSEQVIAGGASETIPYGTTYWGVYNSRLEGKWQGISFADSHPYGFHSNWHQWTNYEHSGTIVNNSYINCTGSVITYPYGTPYLSYPFPGGSFTATDHPAPPVGGKRYQGFYGYGSESYYYLTDDVTQCKSYKIEFDIYMPNDFWNNHYCIGCNADITIAFADHIGAFNFTAPPHSFPMTMGMWQHVAYTFDYCGTLPSNILYIGNPLQRDFLIDNLSLTLVATPPIGVTVVNAGTTGCNTSLVSTVTNPGCAPTHYTWTGGSSIACSTCANTTVSPTVTTTYTLTVTDMCGIRTASTTIIVNPAVLPISGPSSVCVGSTITLVDPTPGGTWTSGSTGIATVGTSSGIVTGVSTGTSSITYTSPTGCRAMFTVTVTPPPTAILGTTSLCVGQTVTLSDLTGGGSWSSSGTGVATVGTGSGIVTGLSAGTETITYSIGVSCYTTVVVTVNPLPAAITGSSTVCVGSNTTLSSTTGGGIWSSSTTSVATVGTSSGIVYGVSSGTSTISYTLPTGCYVTFVVTVNPLPAAITGSHTVCVGSVTTLSSTTGGGVWSSSTTGVATVGTGTGDVTGVSAGTTTISYTVGGCYVTFVVTVNPLPAAITGSSTVCVGSTTTLSSTTGGGIWSSSTTSVATVGTSSGIVYGVSSGTSTISYTLPTGCYVTFVVTVNPLPAAITGSHTVCVGSITTLSSTTGGGVWSSSTTGVATVGTGTGDVTGVSAGTTTISYTLSTGCYVTFVVTVNPLPAAITGSSTVCVGSNTTLSSTTGGGIWSSSTTSVATVGTSSGIVYGVSSGTSTISYILPTGCYVTFVVTVNPLPAAITGSHTVCVGSITTLSSTTGGGVWSSSTTGVATVGTGTGDVTGVSAGTTTISYTVGGCYVTFVVTVTSLPAAITGSSTVCVGSTTTLSSTTGGGIWSSSTTSVATVGTSSGIVYGVSSGTSTISYTLPTGCYVTFVVTVNPVPAPITGSSAVCVGSTITLSSTAGGGVWSSSTTGVATVGTGSGIVTGVSSGTSTISYTVGGCYVTFVVTVIPLPVISGPSSLCLGSSITLSSTTGGGTWSSSDLTVATVGTSSGIVTSVGLGTSTITYTVSTGCFATLVVTVNPLPAAITGSSTVCVGSNTTLSSTTGGGIWSSSTTSVATVGTSSGIVYGVSSGTSTISYTLPTGCYVTFVVTVNPLPAAITGSHTVCVGSVTTLSSTTGGGVWSSSSTGVATVGTSTGDVTGVLSGTTTISYTLSTGCYVTFVVTVNPLPTAITGSSTVCVGSNTTLSSTTGGGIWSSSTTSVATVGTSSGTVYGVSSGTSTISYTLPTGCYVTFVVTVNPLPAAITGSHTVCVGSVTTLSSTTGGGVWSSSTTGVAAVGTGTGDVTGVSAGTTTISYTLSTGCYVTFVVTVNPLPTAITGSSTVCVGSTTTLSSTTGGGIWSSSTTSVATVGTSSGIVYGVSSGTSTISYTLPTGCYVTFVVTVNPLPAAITGSHTVCVGSITTLSSTTGGGVWSSSTTGVATVGTGTGDVTGVSAGTTTISYTLSTGCYVTFVVTVNPLPAAITGSSTVCVGSNTTLSSTTGGGAWSSSTTSVATVGTGSGIVYGVSSGTSTISYILPTGCYVTFVVTVNPLPGPILGTTVLCSGTSTILSDLVTGGTWSSSITSVATVGTAGDLWGVTPGTSTISYTLSTGCYAVVTVTVVGPGAITGLSYVCIGSSMTLSCTPTGGTWTSSTTGVATVGTSSGIVYGVSTGTTTITYTATVGGCTGISILVVTVEPLPVVTTNLAQVLCGSATLTATCSTGVTYTWSPGTGLSATTGSSVICFGPFPPGSMIVYTVTVTDIYGCTSTALDTIFTLCSNINCQSLLCKVNASGPPAILALGGNVGTPGTTTIMPSGDYYAYTDVHFFGTVIFSNSIIAIAPAVTMYVDANSDLEMVDCHLFGCSMWHGIVLQSNLTNHSGNLHLSRNTLIEDADVAAVTINDGVMPTLPCLTCPPSMPRTVFSSDGAIFNRNIIGVAINRFPSATATAVPLPPANYPFVVRNSVFTSRDFSNFSDGYQIYPCAWPMTDGTPTSLKITGTWTPPGFPLTSPYNIDNPNAGGPGIPYPFVACKSGLPANIGISMTLAGRYRPVPLTTTGAVYYATITVGDPTGTLNNMYQNLFDELHDGIDLQYSNVSCYGNSFTHMYPGGSPISGGVVGSAPYLPPASVPATWAPHMLCQVLLTGTPPTVSASGPPFVGTNIFYDCQNGVWARDYYDVTGYGASMLSNHGAAGVPATSGIYGYDLFSKRFHAINVSKNMLTNIYYTGILVNSQAATLSSGGIAGSIAVNNNTINANYGGLVPSGQEEYNAITVSNLGTGTTYTSLGGVQVDTNQVTYAYFGIDVENYHTQAATSNMNTISMMMNPGPPATSIALQQQYGIHHANDWNNKIQYNNITGDDRFGAGWYTPFIPFTSYGTGTTADRAIVGVYGFTNVSAKVTCNVVNHSTTGFQFYGTPNTTSWLDNTMHRNEYGYVLKGVIGNQGSMAQASDNIWVGPPLGAGWWWDYQTTHGPNYGTFTIGTCNPTLSTLFVRPNWTGSTTVYDPWNNYGTTPPITNWYGQGSPFGYAFWGINYNSTGPYPSCETQWPLGLAFMPVFHSAAQQTITPAPSLFTNNWMAQMGLWNNIQADTTIPDSSAILGQFYTMAGSSRYAWLTNIENALSDEDITTATRLLGIGLDADTTTATDTVTGVMMADGTLADAVVRNYYDFYNIYLNYLNGVMTHADSLNLIVLANLCPVRDGAIAYEARGLFRIVYDDPGFFNDNCSDSTSGGCDTCGGEGGGGAGRSVHHGGNNLVTSAQHYRLFPNPNEGTFVLQQQVDDTNPVSIEVMDAVGKVIYKDVQAFADNKMKLQLGSVSPGLYLLKLVDSHGKRYNFKFVVAK